MPVSRVSFGVRWLLVLTLAFVGLAQPASAQSSAALVVEQSAPGAVPHWTLTLATPYCGGYRIGDGVYLRPQPPLSLPTDLPDGSVLFEGQPATVSQVEDALRIGPAPDVVWSQVCLNTDRPLQIELLPEAGLSLPADPGSYAIDVWTGANATPITITFEVPGPA
jgi:hypothetical protein